MNGTLDFSGTVALVTGVDGAIGRGVATRLAQGGATLAVVTRDARLVDRWRERPERSLVLEHDMSVEDEVARCVGDLLSAYGRLDVLLSDTGGSDDTGASPVSIADTQLQDFDAGLARRARPAFLALKHVIPAIARGGGGAVVCVSSILGSTGHAGMAAHVAASHAINGMAIVAAKEWAEHAVRVNVIAPASDVALSGASTAGAEGSPPGSRFADEAAALAAFLLSDDASYLTGAVYPVDRGEAARIAFNSRRKDS